MISRLFHRTVSRFFSLILSAAPSSPLSPSQASLSFFFSLFSYQTRQIIPQGILFPASVRCCGSKEGAGATLSHLESNRGPLSKKLISLNIILGASGSRRALTDPTVHPRSPCRHKTLLSQTHASFLHRGLGPPRPPSLPLVPLQPLRSFSPPRLPPVPSLPLIF